MPDQLSFDLKHLIRVCLNDPELRADIFAAIEEGPLPVRTPIAVVKDGDQSYEAVLRTDREKSPGDHHFLVRDGMGWLPARLSEVVSASHDASTMSADELAAQLAAKR